ncbi:hypothetical protein TREMEDRAFT_25510, partial [Tremella mesenterica DSM 1558]|uniref:uncharacterized protein n=1 Tax=Tremella mesenterica (strain ATCC 24925 / CBS 8224 / DSM 1558 / NBRC 9311 / NRRL Y-6157 / RJB 2259-6 / UBC 559-6) TaxID=578456 RepID=UPI0003F4A354
DNTASSWWRDPGLRRCMFNIFCLYGSVFAYGYDGALISSIQAQPSWVLKFNNPTGITLGNLSSSYLYRAFLIFPFLGSFLADRYGRKPVMFIASVLGIVGPIISCFGDSVGSFIAGRIITGISAAFYMTVAPALVAEVAHPRFRHSAQGSYYSMYFIGSFVCGWAGYGCVSWNSNWSWRVLTLLQFLGCFPLLISTLTTWQVESPRWLVKKGRREHALKALADLHANGDQNDELVLNELNEIVAAVELEESVIPAGFMDFFKTPGNRKRLASVVWFAWALSMSGNNLLAYYTPVILVSIGFTSSLKIQAILAGNSAWGLLCALTGAQLLERLGRRTLLLWGSVATIVSFAIFTGTTAGFVVSGNLGAANGALAFLFIFAGCFIIWGFPLPYTYVPEILPYQLRVKGMAIYGITTNAGALYNSLVNPVALEAIGWRYYCMFAGLLVIQTVIAYFLIMETKGLTLEDIAVLFDGADAHIAPALQDKSSVHGEEKLEEARYEAEHV